MRLLELVACTFVAIVVVKTGTSSDVKNKVYIKGIRCNFSDRFIYKNMTCYAKSYSRTFSGINIDATTTKPLYDVRVSIFLTSKLHRIFVSIPILLQVEKKLSKPISITSTIQKISKKFQGFDFDFDSDSKKVFDRPIDSDTGFDIKLCLLLNFWSLYEIHLRFS